MLAKDLLEDLNDEPSYQQEDSDGSDGESDLEDWEEPVLQTCPYRNPVWENAVRDHLEDLDDLDRLERGVGIFTTRLRNGRMVKATTPPYAPKKLWTTSLPGPERPDWFERQPEEENYFDWDDDFQDPCTMPDCYRLANYGINRVIARVWADEVYSNDLPEGKHKNTKIEEWCKRLMREGTHSWVPDSSPSCWVVTINRNKGRSHQSNQ